MFTLLLPTVPVVFPERSVYVFTLLLHDGASRVPVFIRVQDILRNRGRRRQYECKCYNARKIVSHLFFTFAATLILILVSVASCQLNSFFGPSLWHRNASALVVARHEVY